MDYCSPKVQSEHEGSFVRTVVGDEGGGSKHLPTSVTYRCSCLRIAHHTPAAGSLPRARYPAPRKGLHTFVGREKPFARRRGAPAEPGRTWRSSNPPGLSRASRYAHSSERVSMFRCYLDKPAANQKRLSLHPGSLEHARTIRVGVGIVIFILKDQRHSTSQ